MYIYGANNSTLFSDYDSMLLVLAIIGLVSLCQWYIVPSVSMSLWLYSKW